MQQLFYQNHKEPNGSYTHPLKTKEIHRAMTLHPFKNHTYQYRMDHYLSKFNIYNQKHRLLLLQREINTMESILRETSTEEPNKYGLTPSLNKFQPENRDEILSWEYLTGKSVFSHLNFNPKHGVDGALKVALEDIMMQVMQMINKNARQRGRTIDFKEVLYGYRRVNPMYSADYILDLMLVYRKHKGRRMTVPVRRHAYLQQTFTELEVIEELLPVPKNVKPESSNPVISTQTSAFFQMVQQQFNRFSFYNSHNKVERTAQRIGADGDASSYKNVVLNTTIHFILPLAGRFQTFLQFMHNLEEACLQFGEKVALAVMLFHSDTDDRTEDTIDFMRTIQGRYPHHDLRVVQVKGSFSRAIALQQGASLFSQDALLFFVDVDIYISRESLDRIRKNTVQSQQVYYPIVFSQYDPKIVCDETGVLETSRCQDRTSPFSFSQDYGYWRQFGFGIVSIHRSDLVKVGGLDTSIQGWGKEDVDLFNRVLASNLTVFRAADPGLVHIYHPINCDPSLEHAQYQMCLGSKVSTYGSISRLSYIIYSTNDILHKDEVQAEDDFEKLVEKDDVNNFGNRFDVAET